MQAPQTFLPRAGAGLVLTALVAWAPPVQDPDPKARVAPEAESDAVQVLFDRYCVECHGYRERSGGVRLHTHEALLEGVFGDSLVVAGAPEESRVLEVLRLPADDEYHMPPVGEDQPSAEEIAQLEAWIAAGAQAPAAVDDEFQTRIEPLLARSCVPCHGPDEQKSDFRIDALDPDFAHGGDAESWHHVLDMIGSGDMPPPSATPFSDEERQAVVAWLRAGMETAAKADAGERRTVLRRLTRAQYTNSLEDVLGVRIDLGRLLPPDGMSEMGFTNNGEVLQASTLHLDYYQALARAALDQVICIGERPEVTHYRVTFGKNRGSGKVAGVTGGYQSVPFPKEHFTVDILDAQGRPKAGDQAEQAALDAIQKRISVGLRGSDGNRFRAMDDGVLLYSAVPHREKVPKAWQGPSPNLKLEMQRCFPERGDFVMRVRASRGQVMQTTEPVLVALEVPVPMAELTGHQGEVVTPEDALVRLAKDADQLNNLALTEDQLLPDELTAESKARVQVRVPEEGYYQVDLVHPALAPEAMASVRLQIRKLKLDLRPQATEEQVAGGRMVTTIGAAYLRAGQHPFVLGGPFFPGFSHLVVTPLPDDHPLVLQLADKAEDLEARVADLEPALRGFVGTRTDDGMDYATFDAPQVVDAPAGLPQTYTFHGRLEDLPIPEPESGDKEVLSGFLLLGVWNDHLVKNKRETGPPLLVESIEFEAPWLPAWPTAAHRRLFPDGSREDEEAYTRGVLEAFLGRAFRRPAEEAEVERYLGFWRAIRADHEHYEDAVREALVAVLCSPRFLYLAEPEDRLAGEGELSEYGLASRLSYFLWNSPPDERLRRLAARGRLREQLPAQVERLLEDPRRERFVRAFTYEWLRLDRLRGMTVDPDRYPKLSRFVKRDMEEETYRFVDFVLEHDRSLLDLVDADFTMLNQNLAEYYGVPDVRGPHFRPVTLPADGRPGGLLTQGAFLSGHSDGTQPHPIKRAVWLKEKLLGEVPPPPPPNVPDLDPGTPGFDQMTLKEQLVAHRDNPSCFDCHAGIDPYGIAFEHYDAGGMYQSERKGRPVDALAELPDGTEVDGVPALQAHLVGERRDSVARSLIEHLYAYALGRDLHYADEPELARILERVQAEDYAVRSVIQGIVASPAFRVP